MKKIALYILVIIFCSFGTASYALTFSEEEKDLFYDTLISAYLASTKKEIYSLNISEKDKQGFYNHIKNNVNKEELINSSWTCIQNKNSREKEVLKPCMQNWANNQQMLLLEYMQSSGFLKLPQ